MVSQNLSQNKSIIKFTMQTEYFCNDKLLLLLHFNGTIKKKKKTFVKGFEKYTIIVLIIN